jgi:hypothetical protein
MGILLAVVVLAAILAPLIYYAPFIAIRALARRYFYWTFTPANTFSVIVTEQSKSGDSASLSGNIVDLLHGISGKCVDPKSDLDPMNWRVVDNPDPRHETLIYKHMGVQSMGSVFHKPRINIDKRARFAREGDIKEVKETGEGRLVTTEQLQTVTKVYKTRHVFYTGELTVSIKEADTADKLGLDFEIDFAFAREYPVRSVLKLADSSAFLTSLVEKMVNQRTVSLPAAAYIGGEKSAKDDEKGTEWHREELAKFIEKDPSFSDKILEIIGINILSVSIRSVTMSERHRKLLELEVEARKKAEADLITAENNKRIKILENDADADHIERVVIPAAKNKETVAVRMAEAYERNKTVTVYAPGKEAMLLLDG